MGKLAISLACCDYDRTRAIFDGRVPVEGCEVHGTPMEPEETFHRAFKYQEFDVSELSLSSYTLQVSRGENPYVAIPAFVSRAFRHSGIYIRTDRGIARAQDLKGRTIGVPEYQMTANVWIRGMLADEYGVRPQDVHWRNGGIEQPGREERTALKLPAGIELKPIGPGETLSRLLESGGIDAMFGARPPSSFTRGAAIMHVIGIRRSLVERHPWLAMNLMKAFVKAKEIAWYELGQIGHLFTSLPWGVAEFDATRALMGEDYWSYGLKPNLHVLEAFTRYHHEQGLSARKVGAEELFAPSTLEQAKI